MRDQVLALVGWSESLLATTPPPPVAAASATGTAQTAARGDHTHEGGSGTVGPAGPQGEPGEPGPMGPAGPQGDPGTPGTPGATTFQALTDAADYSAGVAGQFVRVNAGGTGLEYGAGQPLDATLTALAGLATGANQLPYSTGTDTFMQTPLTAAGRALLDDADTTTQRTTLGLGSIATVNSPIPVANGGTAATDAATARTNLGLGTAATQAYTEGTFTATATGMTTSVTGTARYVRIGRQVTLELPDLVGTSNSATFTVTGLPAGIPIPLTRMVALVNNGGTLAYGLIQAGGTSIDVYPVPSFGGWATSGAKALYPPPITYQTS